MREIVFDVTEAPEGGYDARALGQSVFTQGDDWDDLKEMVRDAVRCHFGGWEVVGVGRLRLVRSVSSRAFFRRLSAFLWRAETR